jgi:hypothetical protein
MFFGSLAATMDSVARVGEEMTGAATSVGSRPLRAPAQRRPIERVAADIAVDLIGPGETESPRFAERVGSVVREWIAVATSSAALVAVLLQLYLSDGPTTETLMPEWVPSVAVLIGLLAALTVKSAGRLLSRRFILGFGWLSTGLLFWTAGCLVGDGMRLAHGASLMVVWGGVVVHGLALLAAAALAGRTAAYQRSTR